VIENQIIKKIEFDLIDEYKLEFSLIRNDLAD